MKKNNVLYLVDFVVVLAVLLVLSKGLFTAFVLSLLLVVIKSVLSKYTNLIDMDDWGAVKTIMVGLSANIAKILINLVF